MRDRRWPCKCLHDSLRHSHRVSDVGDTEYMQSDRRLLRLVVDYLPAHLTERICSLLRVVTECRRTRFRAGSLKVRSTRSLGRLGLTSTNAVGWNAWALR